MGNDPSPESPHVLYNAQRYVTLKLKHRSGLNSNTIFYASSAYLQVLKQSELKWPKNLGKLYFQTLKGS